MKNKLVMICVVIMMILAVSCVANADLWETFVIKKSNEGDIAPVISDHISGGKLFEITLAGQKAGWGTNIMNGMKVGDLLSVSITRDSSVTGYGPYMNFWITDGSGNYAVLANEPSNTGEWGTGTAYDTTWDILKDATAKIYETGAWVPTGSTFSDFAGYTVATPTSHWGGPGAPDDLLASSYTAYGFNWIFGDTQDNYLNAYLVSDPELTVVPVPAAVILGLLGMGVAGLKIRKFA